jgi:hypothetical protein
VSGVRVTQAFVDRSLPASSAGMSQNVHHPHHSLAMVRLNRVKRPILGGLLGTGGERRQSRRPLVRLMVIVAFLLGILRSAIRVNP